MNPVSVVLFQARVFCTSRPWETKHGGDSRVPELWKNSTKSTDHTVEVGINVEIHGGINVT